jgi:N-methylhydantoinase A
VSLRVVGQGRGDRPRVPEGVQIDRPGSPAMAPQTPPAPVARRVYFGRDGWLVTPVLARADLATPREGPAIVEEYDATCVVPPGARAALDAYGNIVMEV